MADKKVERSRRVTPSTPTQKLTASLSDEGTLDMADRRHDKGRAVLVDKFREREERWRREHTIQAQQAASEAEQGQVAAGPGAPEADSSAGGEGGAR
jgi:hypothetical protein